MSLDRSCKLRRTPAFEVGISIPDVLSKRLDLLVESCDHADIPTKRKEVIAALLLAAPDDAAQLQALLRTYREATVADARVGDSLEPLLPQPSRHRVLPPGIEKTAPETRLCRTAEKRLGLSLPGPLSTRLDALLERVRALGENTTRQEVVAALVLDSPLGEALAEMVPRYWRARIDDAIIDGEDIDRFLDPQPPPRGPRPRRRRQTAYTEEQGHARPADPDPKQPRLPAD